jgi:hypothetical protein
MADLTTSAHCSDTLRRLAQDNRPPGDDQDLYTRVQFNPTDRRLRAVSGRVSDTRPLVSFLYDLLKCHLPAGTVEQLVRDSEKPDTTHYTNGFIARYAQDIADRLGVIQPDDSEEEEEEEEEEEVVVEEFEADIEVELEPLGPELLVTVGRVIDRMRESKSDTPAATEPEAVVESPAEPTSLSERCLKPLYDIMTAGSKFPGPFFHPRNAKGS